MTRRCGDWTSTVQSGDSGGVQVHPGSAQRTTAVTGIGDPDLHWSHLVWHAKVLLAHRPPDSLHPESIAAETTQKEHCCE